MSPKGLNGNISIPGQLMDMPGTPPIDQIPIAHAITLPVARACNYSQIALGSM